MQITLCFCVLNMGRFEKLHSWGFRTVYCYLWHGASNKKIIAKYGKKVNLRIQNKQRGLFGPSLSSAIRHCLIVFHPAWHLPYSVVEFASIVPNLPVPVLPPCLGPRPDGHGDTCSGWMKRHSVSFVVTVARLLYWLQTLCLHGHRKTFPLGRNTFCVWWTAWASANQQRCAVFRQELPLTGVTRYLMHFRIWLNPSI